MMGDKNKVNWSLEELIHKKSIVLPAKFLELT